MKKLMIAKKKHLTEIGNVINIKRKWYERLPFIGDKIFRNRCLETYKNIYL